MEFKHYSVLLNETIEGLSIKPDGIYVDGTMGGGGHSLEIAKRLTHGRLYGIDQDEDAQRAAKERLADFSDRVTFIHDNYENMLAQMASNGVSGVDGIVLDLGVSSYQLDTADRGFSYMVPEASLDMRMDQGRAQTAADIVNTYSEDELARIIRDYGEDRFARNIAKNIVIAREKEELKTVGQLNEIIASSIPKRLQATSGHPSKRTFQAIRIELNRELEVLENNLNDFIKLLNPGGRLAIITFHSLEDRIVKNCFKTNQDPCTCPKDFPVCVCNKKPMGRIITRKPILPSAAELEENSRSKSAKLRIFEAF